MTKYYKVVRHFLKYLVSTKYNRELIARKGKEKYKQSMQAEIWLVMTVNITGLRNDWICLRIFAELIRS